MQIYVLNILITKLFTIFISTNESLNISNLENHPNFTIQTRQNNQVKKVVELYLQKKIK